MPSVVKACKYKGVWRNESSVNDANIPYLNENVVIFGGAADKIVHRSLKGEPSAVARKERGHEKLRVVCSILLHCSLCIVPHHMLKSGRH